MARYEVTDEFCAMVIETFTTGGYDWLDRVRVTRNREVVEDDGDMPMLSLLGVDDFGEGKNVTVDYTVVRAGIAALFDPKTKVATMIREGARHDIEGGPGVWGCGVDVEVADAIIQLGLYGELIYD